MNNTVQMKSCDELTLCLKASLEQGESEGFTKEMKKDFRKLEARFRCEAKGGEAESCVRFIQHALGCTFKGEQGSCEAGS